MWKEKFRTDYTPDTLQAERCQESCHEDVGEEGGVLQLAESWCEVHTCNSFKHQEYEENIEDF